MRTLMSLLMIVLGIAVFAPQGRAQYLESYYCVPNTCLYIASAPVFSTSMGIYGHFINDENPNQTRNRGLIGFLWVNCTYDVSGETYADTINEPMPLGDGIEVHVSSVQFGITLLDKYVKTFMYGKGGTGGGSSPCL